MNPWLCSISGSTGVPLRVLNIKYYIFWSLICLRTYFCLSSWKESFYRIFKNWATVFSHHCLYISSLTPCILLYGRKVWSQLGLGLLWETTFFLFWTNICRIFHYLYSLKNTRISFIFIKHLPRVAFYSVTTQNTMRLLSLLRKDWVCFISAFVWIILFPL